MNPHERRRTPAQRQERDEMARAINGGMASMGVAGRRRSPLELADLEGIAYRHRWEGFREGRESRDDEIQGARWQAWDEGFAIGSRRGREEMLERIDELVGVRIRAARDDLTALAKRIEGQEIGQEDTRELCVAVANASRLLEHLIDLHHHGFIEELPF